MSGRIVKSQSEKPAAISFKEIYKSGAWSAVSVNTKPEEKKLKSFPHINDLEKCFRSALPVPSKASSNTVQAAYTARRYNFFFWGYDIAKNKQFWLQSDQAKFNQLLMTLVDPWRTFVNEVVGSLIPKVSGSPRTRVLTIEACIIKSLFPNIEESELNEILKRVSLIMDPTDIIDASKPENGQNNKALDTLCEKLAKATEAEYLYLSNLAPPPPPPNPPPTSAVVQGTLERVSTMCHV